MKNSRTYNFPNLAKQFRNRDELAKVLFCSHQTVTRSLSGKRPFSEYEIKRLENYTGLSREFLLKRRVSEC